METSLEKVVALKKEIEKMDKKFTEVPLNYIDQKCRIPLLTEPPCAEGLKDYNEYLLKRANSELIGVDLETTFRSYRNVVRDLFAAHAYIQENEGNIFDTLELIEGLIAKYKKTADDSIGYVQDPPDIFGE